MRILVACEESQAVCKAFRELGYEAFSCDILECSGGHPEWHIQADVVPLLNGNCTFVTSDGHEYVQSGAWDMILAFPPCTHLASSGQHWFSRGHKDPSLREEAAEFFMKFINADCERIAVENPIGIMSTRYRKPDQIIQPYWFGHPHRKSTCLWLKNLPQLEATNLLDKPDTGWENEYEKHSNFRTVDENGRVTTWRDPITAKIRSKTYSGVAKAMAEQWGE